jgi:serine acetyltransferase
MMKQEMYSHGPVEIGDDVWIGAGVTILDGVKIGSGSVIGAGSVVRENIPENTTVTPHQRLVMLPKKVEESKKEA